MKKIYLQPTTNIVYIETHHIMAASENLDVNDSAPAITDEGSVAARREKWGDCWADEEEDDEE